MVNEFTEPRAADCSALLSVEKSLQQLHRLAFMDALQTSKGRFHSFFHQNLSPRTMRSRIRLTFTSNSENWTSAKTSSSTAFELARRHALVFPGHRLGPEPAHAPIELRWCFHPTRVASPARKIQSGVPALPPAPPLPPGRLGRFDQSSPQSQHDPRARDGGHLSGRTRPQRRTQTGRAGF